MVSEGSSGRRDARSWRRSEVALSPRDVVWLLRRATMDDDAIGEPILIRFDGLDAANHEIEMAALAESLRGISRILAVCGNFAATREYVQHKDAMAIRVVARPPESHCFELWASIRWASENPLISTFVGGLFVTLVAYIFKRAAGEREEMKQLRGALDQAIRELGGRDQAVVERLLDTVDKMADALRPAAKQAVAPIGVTARSLTIGSVDRARGMTVGEAEKAAIAAEGPSEVGQERSYIVVITELDLTNGSCKLALTDDPDNRIAGRITDPAIDIPNNPYALAFAAMEPLAVRAKATIRNGEIQRLFISDTDPSSARDVQDAEF